MNRRLLVTSMMSLAGCSPAPPLAALPPAQPCPSVVASAATSDSAPETDKTRRKISITLDPRAEPSAIVHVEISLIAPADELTELFLTDGETPLESLVVEDQAGTLAVTLEKKGAALAATLPRTVSPPLRLRYDVTTLDPEIARPLATRVDPNLMRVSGEVAILLPRALDEQDASVSLSIAAEAGSLYSAGAASSFGYGKRRNGVLRGGDLRHATFLAGPVGHASFDGYDGHDEAAWLGYTSFDPRWIAAETAGARTAIDQFFGISGALPFTVLLLSGKRADEPVSVFLRSQSLLVTTHLDAPWSSRPRLAIGRELVHRWLGGRLIVEGAGDSPRQAAWLSEGVGRFVARENLLALGTLTIEDVADDINATLALLATSPHRGKSARALAETSPDEGAMALAMARGSLWAQAADVSIRASSKGTKSLREVLRALVKLSEERKTRALLPADWDAALGGALSAEEVQKFHTTVLDGARDVDLPDGALGPCFRRERVRHAVFDLGFDALATSPQPAHHVRANGPAARAGLREGDSITAMKFERGATAVPVSLEVRRGEKTITIGYRPAGPTKDGFAFVRRREIPDERCGR